MCPEIPSDGLVVDVAPGPRVENGAYAVPTDEIWISEAGPGGNGLMEQFFDAYVNDPGKF